MLKTRGEGAHLSSSETPYGAPPRECVVEAPYDSAPFAVLRRKISSRLARHVALVRRRLVNKGPMVSFTFDDAPVIVADALLRSCEIGPTSAWGAR
jgi:hypothetical protein